MIGFEGAASLPYDGCVALTALKKANLRENTSLGKKVLIEDGCSPVGCVLTQVNLQFQAIFTTFNRISLFPAPQKVGRSCNGHLPYSISSSSQRPRLVSKIYVKCALITFSCFHFCPFVLIPMLWIF